jgi:hypothetical protein
MEIASSHLSGTQNFEMAPRFFEKKKNLGHWFNAVFGSKFLVIFFLKFWTSVTNFGVFIVRSQQCEQF